MAGTDTLDPSAPTITDPVRELANAVQQRAPREAAEFLQSEDDAVAARVLQKVNPSLAENILWQMSEIRRTAVLAAAPLECSRQWTRNHSYPNESVGRLMDPP